MLRRRRASFLPTAAYVAAGQATTRRKRFAPASELLETRQLMSSDGSFGLVANLTAGGADADHGAADVTVSQDADSPSHAGACCCAMCATPVADPQPIETTDTGVEAAAAAVDLTTVFKLNSLAGANQTIYLDFNGHTTTGTYWNSSYNGGKAIVSPAYDRDGDPASFSDAELTEIYRIWQRVSEDFRPFNVNVTTQDPGVERLRKSGAGDTQWGVRAVQTANQTWLQDDLGSKVGGIAYTGSFNWDTDTPVFSFNSGEVAAADTLSHEVGHSLGLAHDGTSSATYYSGHGSGATGWAPIMGASFSRSLSQWSKGEYPGANQKQDDLAVISTQNGFGYRGDDHGGTNGAATLLSWAGASLSSSGIIERNTDVDVFSIDVSAAGTLSLDLGVFERGPNLDILAELYNSAGILVASGNPAAALGASLSVLVGAGRYYLHIDGEGKAATAGDAGYSDYGSLGSYTVSGSFTPSAATSVVTVAAAPGKVLENAGTDILYTFTRTGDLSSALTASFAVGGTAAYGSDYTVVGATTYSPTAGTVTFAPGSATAVLRVRPVADSLAETDETILVTLVDAPGYEVGAGTAASGTIGNDDLPSVVASLVATAVSDKQINLSWSLVLGATGYKVERSADGGATWTQIASTTATAYSDAGLEAGTQYSYRARATSLLGDGLFSLIAAAKTLGTAESGWKFDFGTSASPAAAGYAKVTEATKYSAAAGYGWLAGAVAGRDRGAAAGDAVARDFNFGSDVTFAADLPDGTYNVTLRMGDAAVGHDLVGVFLEGVQADTVTTAAGQVAARTYTVAVADGQLTVRLRDLGGADPNAVLNALEITLVDPTDPTDPTGPDPGSVTRFDFGTSASPAAAGYTKVTEATKYSAAAGYGWLAGTVAGRDRGAKAGDELARDLNFGGDITFAVNLPNGTYQVTLRMGDATYAHDLMAVSLEGVQADTVSTAKGQVVARTYTVAVADGQLTVRLRDLGGADPSVVLNALEVAALAPPDPAGPTRLDHLASSSPVDGATGAGGTAGGGVQAAARDEYSPIGVSSAGAFALPVTTATGQVSTRTDTAAAAYGASAQSWNLGETDPTETLNPFDLDELFAGDTSSWLLV